MSSYAASCADTCSVDESSDDEERGKIRRERARSANAGELDSKRHSSYMEAEGDGSSTPTQSPESSPVVARSPSARTAPVEQPIRHTASRNAHFNRISERCVDQGVVAAKGGGGGGGDGGAHKNTKQDKALENANASTEEGHSASTEDEDEKCNRVLAREMFGGALPTRKEDPEKAAIRIRQLSTTKKYEKEQATPEKSKNSGALFTKRAHIALEMLETEKTLVKALKQILDWYIKPLADKAGVNEKDIRWQTQILKKEEIAKVFNGIPELYRFHNSFIERIQEVIDGYTDENAGGIADIFKIFPSKGLPPHLNFCNMFYVSMACLDESTATNEAFAQFLQDKRDFHIETRHSLKDLLIMPIQRVPRYVILIQRILESTPPDHPDHDALRFQMHEMTTCAEKINERKGNVEAVDKLKHEITSLPGPPLYNGARYLVHEMKVYEVGKKDRRKTRMLFLFDDMLVITTPRVKSRSLGVLSSISASMSGNNEMFYQFRWKVNIDFADDVKEIERLRGPALDSAVLEGDDENVAYFSIVVKMDLPKKSHGGLSAGPSPLAQRPDASEPWSWGKYVFSGETTQVDRFIEQANILMNQLKRSKDSTSRRNGFYETIRIVQQERRAKVQDGSNNTRRQKSASSSSSELHDEEIFKDELARDIEREHTLYGGYLKLCEAEQKRTTCSNSKARRKDRMAPAAINALQKKEACYRRAKECEAKYKEATGECWPTPLLDQSLETPEKNSKGRWASVV